MLLSNRQSGGSGLAYTTSGRARITTSSKCSPRSPIGARVIHTSHPGPVHTLLRPNLRLATRVDIGFLVWILDPGKLCIANYLHRTRRVRRCAPCDLRSEVARGCVQLCYNAYDLRCAPAHTKVLQHLRHKVASDKFLKLRMDMTSRVRR